MDRGEKQRAIANSIKQIVKYTSRQKATTIRSSNPIIRIAPKSSNNSNSLEVSSSNPIRECQGGAESQSDSDLSHNCNVSVHLVASLKRFNIR